MFIAALQASRPVHLGVDNANALLDMLVECLMVRNLVEPYELLVDGDLACCLFISWLMLGGLELPGISKVKGHADEGLVRGGRVREVG